MNGSIPLGAHLNTVARYGATTNARERHRAPLELETPPPVLATTHCEPGLNLRIALKSSAIIGASLGVAGACKAAAMAGLGELHRVRPKEATGLAVGVVLASSVMIVPGVRAFARALEPVTGKLSKAALHAFTLAGWGCAMAAALAPAYVASRSRDADFLAPMLLANSAAQVVMSLAAEAMTGPVLGVYWPRVHLENAQRETLMPGTPAYADHVFKGTHGKKIVALTLPPWLAHGALAAGASKLVEPLSRALCGSTPAQTPFGGDPYDQFMSTMAIMTSVAVVEACRISVVVGSQAFANSFWGVSTHEDMPVPAILERPAEPVDERSSVLQAGVWLCAKLCAICESVASIVKDDDARLRLFIYSTFLNLTVAALVVGPKSDVVRGLSPSDDEAQLELTAFMLSLFANSMLGLADAAVPLARRPAPTVARVEDITAADFLTV